MTRRTAAIITDSKPAGPDHRVVSVQGGSAHDYQRRPCPTCPWRKDAVGEFPAEAFRHSAHTCYDLSMETFGCHSAGLEGNRTCAGFLLSLSADHNMRVRLAAFDGGGLDRRRIDAGGHDLFDTYREMAVANGVHPDDPVLALCR